MSIYLRKYSTGSSITDRVIDDFIDFYNRNNIPPSGTGTIQDNPYYKLTDIGGHAFRVSNKYGSLLNKGYVTKISPSSTDFGVTLSIEDDFEFTGVVWEPIPAYSTVGYIVMFGPADAYFNSLGSTAGHAVRMSRSDDTVNTDTGKACSVDTNEIDVVAYSGQVSETRSGEGLARCILKR